MIYPSALINIFFLNIAFGRGWHVGFCVLDNKCRQTPVFINLKFMPWFCYQHMISHTYNANIWRKKSVDQAEFFDHLFLMFFKEVFSSAEVGYSTLRAARLWGFSTHHCAYNMANSEDRHHWKIGIIENWHHGNSDLEACPVPNMYFLFCLHWNLWNGKLF